MTTKDLHRYLWTCLMLGVLCLVLLACGDPDGEPLGTAVATDFVDQLTGDPQGSGTVAVTDLRRASVADLAEGVELDADQRGMTPYYVDVTFTNKGHGPVDLHAPSGVDAGGRLLSPLVVVDLGGGVPDDACPALPTSLAAGDDVAGCAIVLVPEDAELERVSYLAGAGAEPVYWLAS